MASSRRVSNDVISQPPLSAQLCSAVLWAVAVRAVVLFGVEQPNEQQAEVRNVAPTALPSDYHTKTYLCVCLLSTQFVWVCMRVSLGSHCCRENLLPPRARVYVCMQARAHTHTQKLRGTSVMRSEESKSKGPQRCTLSGVKRERKREEEKAVQWGGMGKQRTEDGRLVQVSSDRLGTSDTFSPRLTSVQQLVLSHALCCLPRHFFVLPHTQTTHRLSVHALTWMQR